MQRSYDPDDIIWATRHLDVAMSGLVAALSRSIGISVPEMLALEHLADAGTSGPSELARRLQMSSGAVTALVDRLEAAGLVARERHAHDRRRVLVRRTSRANERIAQAMAPLVADILALAEGMSADERTSVGRFLERFTAAAERRAREACRP